MQQGTITIRQFTILIVMFIIGSSILLIPSALAIEAKQDAWISSIIGMAAGLAIIVLLNAFGARMPGPTFVQSCKQLLGTWAGTAVALLFVLHAFLLSTIMLRYIGDFMTTQIMPETPIEAIHLVFIVIVIMASVFGLETIARSAEVFFPWVLMFIIILAAMVSSRIDLTLMCPILENGIAPVIKGSFPLIGIPYLELVLLLMIYPSVMHPEKRARAFLIGGTLGGAMIVLITLLTIAVLGPYLTQRNMYASFALTKKISIGQLMQRVEALLAVTWFLTIFFKTTITYYVAAKGAAELLGLKRHRSILTPLGAIMVVYAPIVYPNIAFGIQFAGKVWTPYAAVFGIVLPLVLIAAAAWRKRKTGGGPARAGTENEGRLRRDR